MSRQIAGVRWRDIPTVDRVVLVAVLLTVTVSVGRFAVVAATVPYASYVLHKKAVAARDAGEAPPQRTVAQVVVNHRFFESWWGGRRIPYRAGGDYLEVVNRHSAARTLGTVLATVVERERRQGANIVEVHVPEDSMTLLGREVGGVFTRADGTQYRNSWASVARSASAITTVRISEDAYSPLLSESDLAVLTERTQLDERTERFLIAHPQDGGSDEWILHAAIIDDNRFFLLVPMDLSPVGDSL